MDPGRVIYRLAELYVLGLLAAAVFTVAWLLAPSLVAVPELAGVWFAAGGFGLLVLLLFVFMFYAR